MWPWHSPDTWTHQPHTYAFQEIHASHLVTTQVHERFKHVVQDLGDREANQTWGQPSIGTDPLPVLGPKPCGTWS